MTRIAAICTDGDGTLWDTEEMLFGVYVDMLSERGRLFQPDDYRAIVGQSSERATEIVMTRFGLSEDPQAFTRERRALSNARLKDVKAMPGAERFLAKCAAAKLPIALVSSAIMAHISTMLDVTGFRPYFAELVVADTPELGGRHKPLPDPYLLGARKLGIEPRFCLGLEDTWHGALSAFRAGLLVAAAPHRFSPRERFTPEVAHYVIPEGETPADLDLEHLSSLLPP